MNRKRNIHECCQAVVPSCQLHNLQLFCSNLSNQQAKTDKAQKGGEQSTFMTTKLHSNSGNTKCTHFASDGKWITTKTQLYWRSWMLPTLHHWSDWTDMISGLILTLSPPIPLRLNTLPYWSNPSFLIFDIWTLWRSRLSARVPKCQKLIMVGLTSMALNPSNSRNLE